VNVADEAADAIVRAERLLANGDVQAAAQQLARAGAAALADSRMREAMACWSRLRTLAPGNIEVNLNYGVAAMLTGEHALADVALREVLDLQPDNAIAHCTLGFVCSRQARPAEAIKRFKRALRLRSVFPEAHNGLANELSRLGDLDNSIRHYHYALAQRPEYAECHTNLADDLLQTGDYAGAEASYQKAVELQPNLALAHVGLGGCLLRRGAYVEAWRALEWRPGLRNIQPYYRDPRDPALVLPRPSSWLAQLNADSRLLVFAEQGLGDTLFYLRFLPLLAARVATIEVLLPAELLGLVPWFKQLPENVRFVEHAATTAEFACASGELPLVAGHAAPDGQPPPLQAEVPLPRRAEAAAMLSARGHGPWLGLAWRAGLATDGVRRKELPLRQLAESLADWPGQIAVVQRDPTAEEMALLGRSVGDRLLDLSALNADLPAMAACLIELDEFVSVSSTNVHLAAALGRSARVLVRATGEWRWHGETAQSPWFPAVKVYREVRQNGWGRPLALLALDLAKYSTRAVTGTG